MKRKVAIIGSGISALGAVWSLKNDYEVTIFEKDQRLGGHTNTVEAIEPFGKLSIDTGFIVYNTKTYPNLTKMFEDCQVETEWSDMSFSYQNIHEGLEWAGNNLNSIFGQRKNLVSPKFWKFIHDILSFKKIALRELDNPSGYTLGEFLNRSNFSDSFAKAYILPMGSAIWSMPENDMLKFPALTFLEFFSNHGLLGPNDHLKWRTVKNGAKNYIHAIIKKYLPQLKLNANILAIERSEKKVLVRTADNIEEFDAAILATHADVSLKLIANPTDKEKRLLSKFRYQKNKAVLHSDTSLLPKRKRCYASWNYRADSIIGKTSVAYYMNRLQNLQTKNDYILSLNEFARIDESKINYKVTYEHPIFDQESFRAQTELESLNNTGPIFFSGSYFKYGFHEDGLTSALNAARRMKNVFGDV